MTGSTNDLTARANSSGNLAHSTSTGHIALCASCDRCRARKTKCDGKRPCGNCATKYMKKHKITSIEGVPYSEFDCVYSPAKRRGPVPRSQSARKASEMRLARSAASAQAMVAQQQAMQQQDAMGNATWSIQSGQSGMMASGGGASATTNAMASLIQQQQQQNAAGGVLGGGGNAVTLQKQLELLQQLQQQQQVNGNNPANNNSMIDQMQQQIQQQLSGQTRPHEENSSLNANDLMSNLVQQQGVEQQNQRIKLDQPENADAATAGVPRTITMHTHLLERSDPEGLRLYAFYKLSIDELFRLPPTPTDEEFCTNLGQATGNTNLHPSQIPGSHLAAMSAARFAEVALGALVHNQVSLGMELCNAVVHCLRESVQESSSQPNQHPDIVLFQVAKAYFLLGVFRACRGDMRRYFQYRRVCMTYLSNTENDDSTAILLSSISFLDSWAYMIYNANEKDIPVDGGIPAPTGGCGSGFATENELKFQVKTDCASVACNPRNANWIQGPPPVYLNNEAPLHARALDALACAVRTCCDQANNRFLAMAKEAGMDTPDDAGNATASSMSPTDTTAAVMNHEDELCSRNLVLSAFTLIQHHESTNKSKDKNEGLHMIISAMDAFLENSGDADDAGGGGFSDSQIQSLLAVCNTTIENPFLLHHAGPTYHMVTNAAVMLCHLLNGMFAMKHTVGAAGSGDSNGHGNSFGPMEETMFEEVMDTYVSIRKVLTTHRRKLPVKLRCHGLPRPNYGSLSATPTDASTNPSAAPLFVDLGETVLCSCRGCQGFVLMACSPCVAAERAREARLRMQVESAQETEAVELGGDLDRELDVLGEEFNVDDDALLNMISSIIT